MFRPLALVVVAGLVFTIGCGEKKPIDKIPTKAPEVSKGPGTVLGHLQYAMVRKDPKHLEIFFPADKNKALGGGTIFHYYAGEMAIKLTAEEIQIFGVQDLVDKGYLNENWTSYEYKSVIKELDEGKRKDYEPGMEKVNQMKLDMPRVQLEKKIAEKLNKELTETFEANPRAIYTAGLYRLLKAIPDEGWPLVNSVIVPYPGDDKIKYLKIMYGEQLITTLTVGQNPDETMYIMNVVFNMRPGPIAKMFPKDE
ncbi:MAG: hypothetical protein FWG02_09295 [Holophagaceae bacterium]|nr:hypothetical protein [Holophagaceae bacterium]